MPHRQKVVSSIPTRGPRDWSCSLGHYGFGLDTPTFQKHVHEATRGVSVDGCLSLRWSCEPAQSVRQHPRDPRCSTGGDTKKRAGGSLLNN